MNKPIALILIFLIAPMFGGIYGIIHDQITYTISEEYYTKFKFIQFGLDNWGIGENIGTLENPEIKLYQPRFGASIVGFLATWWVGMITGIVLGLVGCLHKNGKDMFIITMKAFLITIGVALIIGLIGLLYGKLFLIDSSLNWHLPENLNHKASFIMVGAMHNFSYLGGVIGLIISVIYSVRARNNKAKENDEK